MVMAELKLKKWGNSLGIIIPREIVKTQDLEEGDSIKIDLYKNTERMNGFGMFKGIPSFKRERDPRDDRW